MRPTGKLGAVARQTGFGCAVAASSTVRATTEQLADWRRHPVPVIGAPLSAALLKNSDDQTVAGLVAVLQAIHHHAMVSTCFTRWGVLAGPRFLARVTLAGALQKFAAEGAWGISPHLIPHRSLHSLSGTVSQALQIHGPNLGVGGGPSAAAEALLLAPAFLTCNNLPGVWLVLTGWDREPVLNQPRSPALNALNETNGHPPPAPLCGAVALALTLAGPAWQGPILRIHAAQGDVAEDLPLFSLEGLLEMLGNASETRELNGGAAGARAWRLDCGGWIEWQAEKRW